MTRQTRSDNSHLHLTPRDLDLFASLNQYRYLSTSQIQRLHFPSTQTLNRRLRILIDAGYISAYRVPGFQERLVSLTRRGAEALASSQGLEIENLDWKSHRSKPKHYYFLQHFLSVTDFRISLAEACANDPLIQLLGFIPEYRVANNPDTPGRSQIRDSVVVREDTEETLSHIPDGVFVLQWNDIAALFFLEVDRGTEVLSDPDKGVLKLVRFYLHYLSSGGYQRYREDFGVESPFLGFRLFLVTSSVQRMGNIREACGKHSFHPEHAKRFLWATTNDKITSQSIFRAIWSSLDPEDRNIYAIQPT